MIRHIIRHSYYNQSKNLYKSLFARQYSDSAAYAGDGKTTIQVINQNDPNLNYINTYSPQGFRLTNNLFINGSILLFPTHVYSWNVRRGKDITPESLIVFDLILPKVKMLIIGYGEKDEPYDAKLPMLLRKKGISCEMLPTPHAVSTYNYMLHDAVHVAGAFVPVKYVEMTNLDEVALLAEDSLTKEQDYTPLAGYQRTTTDEEFEGRDRVIRTDKDKKTFDE